MGKLVAARDTIGDGFFQPRAASRESEDRSSVRLLDKRRGILFEVELVEHEALRFLRALGLDPASRRAEFRGASPVFPTLGRQIGGFFAALGAGILVGVVGAVVHVNLVPVLPLLLAVGTAVGLVPSKIAVGVDGVLFRWLWTKKFVPMSDIRDVGVADDNAFRITLSSGARRSSIRAFAIETRTCRTCTRTGTPSSRASARPSRRFATAAPRSTRPPSSRAGRGAVDRLAELLRVATGRGVERDA